MEHGFNATSMRQIAERAGLALGGIYNHYKSKEEIFRTIILERHPYKQILPLVLNVKGRTPEEFFRNAAHTALGELGKRPDFLKLMFIEAVEFNGKHISLIMREILPKVMPVFEEACRATEVSPADWAGAPNSFIHWHVIFILSDRDAYSRECKWRN